MQVGNILKWMGIEVMKDTGLYSLHLRYETQRAEVEIFEFSAKLVQYNVCWSPGPL